MPKYNPAEIEPKWQRFWDENQTFRTPDRPGDRKKYILDMFPYPSGSGLHVGHLEGYTATDILARYFRMNGFGVLHPMGYDSFGLPAEEHAIKTNTPPRQSTEKNIANFRRQLRMLGFSYDWERELATTDVEYFRWTQWIFLVLFDTWFDKQQQKGRPISELPIPAEVQAQGDEAIRTFQDEHRLAFQAEAPVNWCPALGTVLANEEVIDGLSERGSYPVERLPLRQWMLRITAYGDRLENDLEKVNWPEGIKKRQKDWIGRSTGAEVDFFVGSTDGFDAWKTERITDGFPVNAPEDSIRIYTTRPDTLFGATYMVLAPEHPLVGELTTDECRSAIEAYQKEASFKSDRERQEDRNTKTGVFTGAFAVNPANGESIPIWIADYVLASYGTGAIMAVPAHDERDFDFACQFSLKVIPVIDPASTGDKEVDAEKVLQGEAFFVGNGKAINSGSYDGIETSQFKSKMIDDLSQNGLGRAAVNYKLRDWLFSRQRYWGEPFPILHELDDDGNLTGMIRAVPENALPVDLPHMDDYKPHGRPEPMLAKASDEWLYPVIDGKKYKRETNTMPQWAGSCWYYIRFLSPDCSTRFVDEQREREWMPVDTYIGGAEHAVLHLLYARFWHKVLFDRGYLHCEEPFHQLVNQGMILGPIELTGFKDFDEKWVSSSDAKQDAEKNWIHRKTGQELSTIILDDDQVEKKGDSFVLVSDSNIKVMSRTEKMAKSKGNVVNPDEIVADSGADSIRLYEMFMGPLDATKPWNTEGVNGVRSFLDRSWRMIVDEANESPVRNVAVVEQDPTDDELRVLHKTIKAISDDIESLGFNTAIARMMEFVNYFTKLSKRPLVIMEQYVLLLAPFAPHIAEEMWKVLGHTDTLAYEPWPILDESLAQDEFIEIPVQIKGKVRAKIQVSPGTSKDELERVARADDKIAELLTDKQIHKVIVVPDRLVNFVAS